MRWVRKIINLGYILYQLDLFPDEKGVQGGEEREKEEDHEPSVLDV